jgi:hypothetical protein
LAANCANSLSDDVELVPASKRKRKEVGSVGQRANVGRKTGATVWPGLTKAALKLFAMHSTCASTERNWSLWGRVYVASRNALAIERDRKMITFCFNSRATKSSMEDLQLLLDTIGQEVAQ